MCWTPGSILHAKTKNDDRRRGGKEIIMPFTISEINSFVPKKGRNKGVNDPSKDSALYNLFRLRAALKPYEQSGKSVKKLREQIQIVILAAEGKEDGQRGDDTLNELSGNMISAFNETVAGIPDEELTPEQKKLKELFQYSAAGIGDDGLCRLVGTTAAQKLAVEKVRNEGRSVVAAEAAELENKRRSDAQNRPNRNDANNRIAEEMNREERSKNTYTRYIDNIKSKVNKLPEITDNTENNRRQEVIETEVALCLNIIAARRTAGSGRDTKYILDRPMDFAACVSVMDQVAGNKSIVDWVRSLSSEERRKYATTGHGGAMEDAFKEHVKNLDIIPDDIPNYYMPNAKTRCEALQQRMKDHSFTHGLDKRKVDMYTELLATRMAAESVRSSKDSLDKALTAAQVAEARNKIINSPVFTAIKNVNAKLGDEAFRDAVHGHGGKLEDDVREEIRNLSNAKDNGYRLAEVDKRFAPTYSQRGADIISMINSDGSETGALPRRSIRVSLTNQEKIEKLAELALIDRKLFTHQQTENIVDAKEFNREAKRLAAGYAVALTDEETFNSLINATKGNWNELSDALKKFENKNAGTILAESMKTEITDDVEDILKGDPNTQKEKLVRLAAKKMVVDKVVFTEYDEKKKFDALSRENIDSKRQLMENNVTFRKMVDSMDAKTLAETIAKGGIALEQAFDNAAKAPDKPQVEAVPAANVVDGPKQVDPQQKEPVIDINAI